MTNDPASRHQSSYQRPEGWTAPGAALVASAAAETIPAAADLGRIHLMGIAGSGMSALARLLLGRGFSVSGCEHRESATVAELRAQGAEISIGHSLEHLDGIDTFVYTTAINPKHFELAGARARGLQVIRRASALGALVEGHRAIAIAGTHGKTTTTSLLTVGAAAAGLDPSFAIGASLHAGATNEHTNGHVGTGENFIVEADESDGSFLLLHPDIAVITNVEADHLENHGDLAGVYHAFEQFADRITDDGLLITCADDDGAALIGEYGRARGLRVRTYGTAASARKPDLLVEEIVAGDHGVQFSVTGLSENAQSFTINSLVGEHMALNATAAAAVLVELGADLGTVARAWHGFSGVDRRFELRGVAAGVRVYDDYAHHPTEVRAQLMAAQSLLAAAGQRTGSRGKLIAVFQPGTYSRTQTFAIEFGQALAVADVAVVMDIFPAREEPIPGVTGELIAEQVPLKARQVIYEPNWDAVPDRVAEHAGPGDLVLTMGIGDVHLLCPLILQRLELRSAGRGTAREDG
jgi:UDP-N-acetylmuramate--alanine ligase